MKKLLSVFLLAVIVAVLPCLALAGCWRHPDAGDWSDTAIAYQDLNNSVHSATVWTNTYCGYCGTLTGQVPQNSYTENHHCRRGVCMDCGRRVLSTGYDRDAIPSSLSSEEVADLLGPMTIGGSLRVSVIGNAYASPSMNAAVVGRVRQDENFIVDDYCYAGGVSWFRVWYNGQDAWLPAATARFLISYADSYIPGADYSWQVGRTCVILVNMGNVRNQPGMDTRVVAKVYERQCYTILDCTEGPDGKVWYRICADDTYGWISSGIAQLQ